MAGGVIHGRIGGRGVRNETPRPDQADGVNTGLTGLEPATSAVTVRHSNQLSYSPSTTGREANRVRSPRARAAATA